MLEKQPWKIAKIVRFGEPFELLDCGGKKMKRKRKIIRESLKKLSLYAIYIDEEFTECGLLPLDATVDYKKKRKNKINRSHTGKCIETW